MSMEETSRRLAAQKNGQRSAAMDAQIAGETSGADSRRSAPASPGANTDVPALLNKAITRLEELSARMAEVERHIANQRPDAERFAHEIGPIVLATRGLRDEISKYREEIKTSLDSTKREVAATLKQVEGHIGQHRTNIQNDIGHVNGMVSAAAQMVKEGKGLLQQSMSIYTRATQNIAEVASNAAQHVEETARRAGDFLDEQTADLKKSWRELDLMYDRAKDWLISKTVGVALLSTILGAMVGGLMVTFYTMRQLEGTAEVQRNNAKWKYLIERQNKKTSGDGDKINQEIEQELENQEAQGANK